MSTQPTELVYWEEELPEPTDKSIITEKKDELSRRRLFWVKDKTVVVPQKSLLPEKKFQKPHPMRTHQWQLDLKMSLKEACRLGINTTWLLEFSENGYCRQVDSPLLIGKWTLHPSGISWQIPLPATTNDDDAQHQQQQQVQLLCHADLILNPFGKRPRMIRGTIVKDNGQQRWFRPVVATFSGEGRGEALDNSRPMYP